MLTKRGVVGRRECLMCAAKRVLGILITYAKENRLAYRLFVDAVTKRIVPRRQVG